MLTIFIIVSIIIVVIIISKNVIPKYKITILKYKVIKLGTLNTKELTILEWKPLFSAKLFYFEKGTA